MTRSVVVRPDGEPPIVIGKDVLKTLNLNPDDPLTRTYVMVCERYRFDPVLNECKIVKGQVYITRDGMLRIAHRSGVFDGMVTEEQRESDHGWSATVSVWRKDMSHPFTYKGGCGRSEPQAREGHGAEMALARAERRALKRAFAIPSFDDIDDPVLDTGPALASSPVGETPAPTEPDGIAAGRGGTITGDHLLQNPRGAKDPNFTCSCGEIFPTVWGFRVHRTTMLEGPPAEVYDSAPESRGDVEDLQPASYEDPGDDSGRPFT